MVGSAADVAAKAGGSLIPVAARRGAAAVPAVAPRVRSRPAGLDTTCVGTDTDALLEYHRAAAHGAGARDPNGCPRQRAHRRAGHVAGHSGGAHRSPQGLSSMRRAPGPTDSPRCFGAPPQELVPYRRTAAIVRHFPAGPGEPDGPGGR
jgi:hypothetical protein